MGAPLSYRPAAFWGIDEKGRVACRLCPIHCVLTEGKIGVCRGKQNIGGRLWAINYGQTTAVAVDPMEKKPLYHFLPGSTILSVGPNGCNLACDFCQNYHISQNESPTRAVTPEQVAVLAEEEGSAGVAYTYTEPTIWYEFVRDAADAVRRRGLVNVLVTNGMIEPEPLTALAPLVDAMNIDIKSMSPDFYRKVCKGRLEPVLETVRAAVGYGIHVEITNLVIPGLNDADDDFHRLADFIAAVDPAIPLHLSKYHPAYKRTAPPTPTATLIRGADIARASLSFVYVGNVDLPAWRHTVCPSCGATAIERGWFGVERSSYTAGGDCSACGTNLNIVTPARLAQRPERV